MSFQSKEKNRKKESGDEDPQGKDRVEQSLNECVPFFESFDLDRRGSFLLLALWRLFCTTTLTKYLVHPDELYQGT